MSNMRALILFQPALFMEEKVPGITVGLLCK